MRVFVIIILAVFGCFGLFLRPLAAFEMSPAIHELTITAGATEESALVIKNTEEKPLRLFFTVQKFLAGGGGSPRFLPSSDVAGLPEWFRLSAREVVIAPGKTERVRVQVQVPLTAAEGGSYAAIFASEAPDERGSVSVGARIATLWFVKVVSSTRKTPLVPEWRVDGPEIVREGAWWQSQHRMKVSVENVGSVHGLIAAELRVQSLGSSERKILSGEAMRVLPGEQREVQGIWQTWLPVDRVTIEVIGMNENEVVFRREWKRWIVSRGFWAVFITVDLIVLAAILWRIRRRRAILSS